jgi:putative phage-type endonuclease
MSCRKIEIQQRTPEWHAWRRKGIGSSDIAAVMGLNPFKTAKQVLKEKHSGKISNFVNEAMQRGIDFEDEAREAVSRKLGIKFEPACLENVKRPYMIASVDGWSGSQGIEIKVPSKRENYMMVSLDSLVPDLYIPQCQHDMCVTGLPEWLYVAYDDKEKVFADVLVKRDDFMCEKIERACDEFHQMMVNYVPSEEDDYPFFEDTEGFEEQIREAEELSKIWSEKYEVLKDKAIAQVGARNAYLGNLRITKSTRAGAVDYKRIEALKGVDLNQYRKDPVISWRIS